MGKLKIRLSKCFLVQIVDDEGNEISSEYVFTNQKSVAEQRGKEMLKLTTKFQDERNQK